MWISKKRFKALEKRVADLEGQVQSQQKIVETHIANDAKDNEEIIRLIHGAINVCTSVEKY